MSEGQSAALLTQWRMAAAPEQDRIWADANSRLSLQSLYLREGLSLSQGQVDLYSSRCWLAHLSFTIAAGALPGHLVASTFPAAETVDPVPAAWLRVVPDTPLPIDMELDIFAEAIEKQDIRRLLPLLRSMAEDAKARHLIIDRLRLRVAEDGYAHGFRSSLLHAWAQLAAIMPAEDFVPLTMAALQQHWSLAEACAVVVPEGRAERRLDSGKALLQSLRERDLSAYMEHLRGMGDQPIAALRQLFLALGLMILEYPDGSQLIALGEIYLWLAAVLQMPHRSLRRCRRILFSAAADLFRFAGWEAQQNWPGYTELAAFRHALSEEVTPQTYGEDWQRVLQVQALGADALRSWYQRRAEQHLIASHDPSALFWAHWQETQAATQELAGPLLWIHPLVFLRLYPE
ncbi:hypothetical protein AB4090_08985 [Acidithiobacillus sp. IBUN Pt1247-S3]|uniref:hypothetical protein n=1 Tax=Acidithiobacillus sp. IBUN Pt1247-S3 TaxID=3166642 RepID=UPI0034E5C4FB